MSLQNAAMYGRRARGGGTPEAVGDNVKRAVDQLVKVIEDLEDRVRQLEAKMKS